MKFVRVTRTSGEVDFVNLAMVNFVRTVTTERIPQTGKTLIFFRDGGPPMTVEEPAEKILVGLTD